MQNQQIFDLNLIQIQQAASAGLSLLTTPGAVSVPSTMAVTDHVRNLNILLQGLATGQVMVVNSHAPDLKSVPDDKKDKKATGK